MGKYRKREIIFQPKTDPPWVENNFVINLNQNKIIMVHLPEKRRHELEPLIDNWVCLLAKKILAEYPADNLLFLIKQLNSRNANAAYNLLAKTFPDLNEKLFRQNYVQLSLELQKNNAKNRPSSSLKTNNIPAIPPKDKGIEILRDWT